MGNRAPGLRGAQRAGVADLGAKRHAGFDALGEQRIVAAIGGRGVPQPRHHPQADESFCDAPSQLPDRFHRAVEVDGGEPGEPVRMRGNPLRHLVVGDEVLAVRAAPGMSMPSCTPAASIDASVTSIGISVSGIDPPVQRRRDASMSLRRNRCVGCCIQTSIVIGIDSSPAAAGGAQAASAARAAASVCRAYPPPNSTTWASSGKS